VQESAPGTELAKPALRPKGSYFQRKRTLPILAAPTACGGVGLPWLFQSDFRQSQEGCIPVIKLSHVRDLFSVEKVLGLRAPKRLDHQQEPGRPSRCDAGLSLPSNQARQRSLSGGRIKPPFSLELRPVRDHR
jgi:hypothetical protein